MSDERIPGPPVPPRVPGHMGVASRETSLAVAAVLGSLATIERCDSHMDVTDLTRAALHRAELAGLRVRWFTKPARDLWVCVDHGVISSEGEECNGGDHDDE
jgi:hypothetical protein